jgi:hypothetical protein
MPRKRKEPKVIRISAGSLAARRLHRYQPGFSQSTALNRADHPPDRVDYAQRLAAAPEGGATGGHHHGAQPGGRESAGGRHRPLAFQRRASRDDDKVDERHGGRQGVKPLSTKLRSS